MRYGIKVFLEYLIGTDVADRNLAVYPYDTSIFRSTFPEHLASLAVANLLFPEPVWRSRTLRAPSRTPHRSPIAP